MCNDVTTYAYDVTYVSDDDVTHAYDDVTCAMM